MGKEQKTEKAISVVEKNEKGQAKMSSGYRVVWTVIRPFLFFFWRLKFFGEQNVMNTKGGCIVVCNHLSLKDPVILALGIHRRIRFMAKEELFEKNKFFAWLIRNLGAFPINRHSNDTSGIRTAMTSIKNGEVVIIFAEGTRSKTGELSPFERGVAFIAQSCKCEVVPANICFEKINGKRYVDFGEPVNIPELIKSIEKNQRLDTISQLLHQKVYDLHQEQLARK